MTATTRQTLEQQRAQNAWEVSAKYKEEHVKITKSLPALIMNSGLMQVLAFCEQKDGHKQVAADLRGWLSARFPKAISSASFTPFMQGLMKASPQDYQAINTEAFAWLKWLRQLTAARNPKKGDD